MKFGLFISIILSLFVVLVSSDLSGLSPPSLSYRNKVRTSNQRNNGFTKKITKFLSNVFVIKPNLTAFSEISPSLIVCHQQYDHLLQQSPSLSSQKQTVFSLSTPQTIYVILTSIFVTCLLIADIIGVKLFEIQLPFSIGGVTSIEHSCGMLTFPITFLLGDIINEYYGSQAAKLSTYIGLWMSLLVFVIINIAQSLPYLHKPYNITPPAFDMIFGSAKIIYLASVGAYLIGSLADIWLFEVIKQATGGKWLWLRATGSTIISQWIDSFVITYLAFVWGKQLTGQPVASWKEVVQIAVTGYGLKLFLSLAMTPFIYALKYLLTEVFHMTPLPASSITPLPPLPVTTPSSSLLLSKNTIN